MTFRQRQIDYLTADGRVRWTPMIGQRVTWVDKLGEATGRIVEPVGHPPKSQLCVLMMGHSNRLNNGIHTTHLLWAGVLRPINYKGALSDLEIVWDNSDAVIKRARMTRASSSRQARSSR